MSRGQQWSIVIIAIARKSRGVAIASILKVIVQVLVIFLMLFLTGRGSFIMRGAEIRLPRGF